MMHPATRLVGINPQVGVGVIATRLLPVGTILWVRDPLDRTVPDRELAVMPALLAMAFSRHAYLDDEGVWTLCWDHARFVNHACQANSVVTDHGLELACRDIQPGEQITNEYALFHLAPDEEFDCACGSAQCRGHIDSRGDLGIYRSARRRDLQAALACVNQVEQDLWPLLAQSQKNYLKGPYQDDR